MEMQSLKIKRGTVEEFRLHYDNLLELHWNESARNKHIMVLNPDWESYLLMEKANKLVTLCAYDGDKMVGYSCCILTKHLHYADLITAYNDVIFIHKDYRNSSLGIKLIKETEKEVKKEGAHLMLWHAKENTALSKILPRMGCKVQEIIFSKEL